MSNIRLLHNVIKFLIYLNLLNTSHYNAVNVTSGYATSMQTQLSNLNPKTRVSKF